MEPKEIRKRYFALAHEAGQIQHKMAPLENRLAELKHMMRELQRQCPHEIVKGDANSTERWCTACLASID